MENTILESIFETAASLPNIEGDAALNQLLIEAATQFPGTEPSGYSYNTNQLDGETFGTYYLHVKQSDPWPLEQKRWIGIGNSPKEAYGKLVAEMKQWHDHLNCDVVLDHNNEVITDAFLSETAHTDLRTEYAA